jgi:biotin synthase
MSALPAAGKVISIGGVSRSAALRLSSLPVSELSRLFSLASEIRQRLRGHTVDLCAIVNAKSGACPEDCAYCAQSARSRSGAEVYPLLGEDAVLEKARGAKEAGVKRFCIVTSGRKAGKRDLKRIGAMVGKIRRTGLLPCATLGLLDREELAFLKESGLERYHHNVETSERFFPTICSTHSYQDKMRTLEAVHAAGLSLCSGGIFGLGESWADRVDMAFALRDIGADSVPINFLIAVKGTVLEQTESLPPMDALKIVSLYRMVLPEKEIRVCGGRRQVLGEFNAMVFLAGADAILTGNYLTASGTPFDDDLKLIGQCGLKAG